MTDPILPLSFPVRDLREALEYYGTTFGAVSGRREANWADIAHFAAQIALQHDPDNVLKPMPRTRHFGATLAWDDWETLMPTLAGFVEGPTASYEGAEREQAKAMVADPSGNLIEIKALRFPDMVLPGRL